MAHVTYVGLSVSTVTCDQRLGWVGDRSVPLELRWVFLGHTEDTQMAQGAVGRRCGGDRGGKLIRGAQEATAYLLRPGQWMVQKRPTEGTATLTLRGGETQRTQC